MLLNLISNGFYATTTRKAELNGVVYQPTISASTKNLGDSVEICIRDNGTGVPAEVKEKMFDPFFTTKPAGEGTGLGLLAEFGSAVDAVSCAMEAQGALAKANSGLPENRRINFRMGVHVGDVMVRSGDLFGDGVNIAARLQTLAKAGGLCVSGVTYDQVRKILPLQFTDLGAQTVKNIEEAVRAYEVREQGEAASSALGEASSLGDGKPLALPDKPSIAVLPFQNMSGDPEQEYFADGMVEEIITALSRNKQLFVIARNSSFTFKGRAVDIKQVARDLGVRCMFSRGAFGNPVIASG